MIDKKYIYLCSVFLFLTIIKYINPPIIQKISFINYDFYQKVFNTDEVKDVTIVDIDESLKPIYLYGIVKNQTGWINGNLPYDIFTNHTPTSDGEGGMLTSTYGNSLTTTRRKIFFGRTTYTGDFYVRLGVPKQYDNQYNDFPHNYGNLKVQNENST